MRTSSLRAAAGMEFMRWVISVTTKTISSRDAMVAGRDGGVGAAADRRMLAHMNTWCLASGW